jgi:adhesin transport system membrane fusion protein
MNVNFSSDSSMDAMEARRVLHGPRADHSAVPHLLLAVILVLLLLAFSWAAFLEIDEIARAQGRVIPRSTVQMVTNLEGGIIGEIFVREGDLLRKGDPIVRIDPTRFESAYRESEVGLLALKARAARLATY